MSDEDDGAWRVAMKREGVIDEGDGDVDGHHVLIAPSCPPPHPQLHPTPSDRILISSNLILISPYLIQSHPISPLRLRTSSSFADRSCSACTASPFRSHRSPRRTPLRPRRQRGRHPPRPTARKSRVRRRLRRLRRRVAAAAGRPQRPPPL